MMRAAGILFVDPDGQVLFLKRGAGGDHPGAWCFPGGKVEGEETAEQCAVREAKEECGSVPDGSRILWTRRVAIDPVTIPGVMAPAPDQSAAAIEVAQQVAVPEEVDFSTFLQKVDAQFVPKFDGEHVGFAWAPIDQPPEPLHPGCRIALDRFGMDELGLARAIADGSLTSPQKYQNIWLFCIRITGTATAFRRAKMAHDEKTGEPTIDPKTGKQKILREAEFVYRRPESYLTPDFLARCNGLPVIVLHPEKMPIQSDEFSKRIIGTVFLPFIRGNEVWAVAKIFNEQAAYEMSTTQLSTSPGVITGGEVEKFQMEDGSNVLIEGSPALVDHIAICPNGVWDKGEGPTGVETSNIRMDSTEDERPRSHVPAIVPNTRKLDAAMVMIAGQRVANIRRSMNR